MFYRFGGGAGPLNQQQDEVYTDAINGATGWLPVSKGNIVAVNIARASIAFGSSVQSVVTKSALSYEAVVLLEMKMAGGDNQPWPIDFWQNVVAATGRRMHRDGYVRLRVTNINNDGGNSGVALALQVNRNGDSGASY